MAKKDSPAPAENASKEFDRCKELIINIPRELEPPLWPECCIYRVPKRLREVQKMAYTPRLVSIGPFHHRRKELKNMEKQKRIYFWDFCDRTKKSIEDLKSIIVPEEQSIRHCYSENFNHLSSEEFIKMILLDAIFILELFWRKHEKSKAQEKNSGNSKAREKDSGNSKAQEKDSGNSKAREKDSGNSKAYEKDYILSQPCMERGIQHDLLLLENQLPFSHVLEKLYQNKEPTLIELSCGFFGDLYCDFKPESTKCFNYDLVGCFRPPQNLSPCSPQPENDKVNHIKDLVNRFPQDRSSPNFIEVKHFTDLVRYFFCPPRYEGQSSKKSGHVKQCYPDWVGCCCHPKPSAPEPEPEPKHCTNLVKITKPPCTVTKLDEAGLKITRPDSERHLLQIQFREKNCECFIKRCPVLNLSWLLSCLPCLKRTSLVHMQRFLEVPPLRVHDKTEGLFRNLMALEQCHYPDKTYICDYIVLLDDLITTKADVTLLVEKKIIVNELGSSAAVTKLVNNLGLEIEESGNHYEELCEKLNEYYESNWNRLVGTLTTVYFSDFFKGTATVAGIIVLGFTLWNFQRLLRWSHGKY